MDEDTHAPDADAAAASERSALRGLAYRILGSVADAEDAVQETYVRWYRMTPSQRREIRSPRAWLMTTAGRIGVDMLTSARARRERYSGPWLPEPVPGGSTWTSGGAAAVDPADRISTDESVSMAVLVVLEAMTPAERVAFVLHDVFGYTFPEVAEVVGRSPEACRQLAASARRRVQGSRRRPVEPDEHAAAVRAFRLAWETGDTENLIGLLDPNATAVIDGGGVVSAASEPVVGAEAVAALLIGVLARQPGVTVAEDVVNGRLGLLARSDGEIRAVISVDQVDGRFVGLWVVRNPDKIRAWRTEP
ncbi:RNA polymerase sigma factor SigJ [Microbacterium sp. TNHR37B]|uniref:RNA polymerase sigma factor SigJ n=1 Tax=Microbacterium sp. TNHR37B TaxID=1775956 RepID=UPI0007B1B0D9|nr:RNA polymerase sigma factor SigJ [Microbacterium sp. TNHR37B]KZE90891.1 ECF RNA polymerase sigma factor SigJ [Microbacterium sp. TNHR37B]